MVRGRPWWGAGRRSFSKQTLNRKRVGGQDSSEERSGLSPPLSFLGTHLETPTHPGGGDNWGGGGDTGGVDTCLMLDLGGRVVHVIPPWTRPGTRVPPHPTAAPAADSPTGRSVPALTCHPSTHASLGKTRCVRSAPRRSHGGRH